MKRLKKGLALGLAVLMLLSLTACGSFETRMVRAATKMSKLESLHADVTVDAQMSMALFGNSTGLDLEMNAAVDGQKDPGLFGMELELSTLGVSREQLLYGEQLDDGWRIYSSDDGGRSWSSRESEGGGTGLDLSKLAVGDSLKTLRELAATFSEAGEETINGSTAVVYEGLIPREMIQKAVKESGVLDKLSESLEIQLDDSAVEEIGDVPVTIAVDKQSDMILRVTLDLSQAVGGLMGQVIGRYMAEGEGGALMDGLGVEMEVESVRMSMEFSGFDSTAVEIPEQAREAA